jgi:hypothetical protein
MCVERTKFSVRTHPNGKFAIGFVQGLELIIGFLSGLAGKKTPLPESSGVSKYLALILESPRGS